MSIWLDAAVILIMILTCVVGYVRGFRKSIVGIGIAVISTLAASWASGALAEPVYERYMRDRAKAYVVSAINEYDPKTVIMQKLEEQGYGGYVTEAELEDMLSRGGDCMENVSELLKKKGADRSEAEQLRQNLDGYFRAELPGAINERIAGTDLAPYIQRVNINSDELRECITRAASQSKEDAADYIVEKAIKPVLVGVIRTLMFGICYLVAVLLMRVIVMIMGLAGEKKELKAADRFGGLGIGVVKGLIYCAAAAWVLSTFCTATKNSMSMMNADIGRESYVFRYFFEFFYN